MKYDVFISYSRKDTAVADGICGAFEKSGITYFIDRRDIAGGMEFPEELAQALLDAKIVLFLCSRDAYQSKFTTNEIVFALKEKPQHSVIPYILDGSVLPLFLRRQLSNEITYSIDSTPVFPELVDIVRSRIGKKSLVHTVSGIDFTVAEVNTIKGHTDWVLNLAFSPDGSVLATGACDGHFMLWNAGNAGLIRAVSVGAQSVCALLFSPDGTVLYTAQHNNWKGVEGWIGKWNAASGDTVIPPVSISMGYCRNLNIGRNGQHLVASYYGVGIIDTDTMELMARYRVSDNVNSLIYGMAALDRDLTHALVGGDVLQRTVVDLRSGTVLKTYRDYQMGNIENVSGSGDCSCVAVAAGEYISVFGSNLLETPLRRFAYRGEDMECAALNDDGSILAGGTKQGSMILWNVHSGRELYSCRPSKKQIICVAISPDSHAVACGGEEGDVWLIRFPDKMSQ